MKDYQLRLVGLASMILCSYGLATVVLEVRQLFFYFQPLNPLTVIFGLACLFGFALGFMILILNHSAIRENYFQKRMEDFQ